MVVEDQTVVGILTEHDLLTKLIGLDLNPEEARVEELMTKDPECVRPDDTVAFALNLMHIGRYRHIPIVDEENRPLGILSVKDIVNHLVHHFEEEILSEVPKEVDS
jgi:CBS domain-containing protein